MGKDVIDQLAREIVNQTIDQSWKYWAPVVALALVVTYFASWLGSYARKRAEHRSVDADLKKILKQVERTTLTTESIKSVVSLGEWSERELRTLRRIKLEELLLSAHKAQNWLDAERNRSMCLRAR